MPSGRNTTVLETETATAMDTPRDEFPDDFSSTAPSLESPEESPDPLDEEGPEPLARVRYGLGKEIVLYSDVLAVVLNEEAEETLYTLADVKRLILAPGEYTPSKLVVMLDLTDGNTIIAAEGMTNPKGFRQLVLALQEAHPEIELDPPDMAEQLRQALDIRRRHNLGCYGVFFLFFLAWLLFIIIALIGTHAPH